MDSKSVRKLPSMETTYTKARENLASLLDQVVDDREVIIIKRRDNRNVALIAEDELSSLRETAYLLRSPNNAARLVSALAWSKSQDDKEVQPKTVQDAIAELKQELEIGEEKAD